MKKGHISLLGLIILILFGAGFYIWYKFYSYKYGQEKSHTISCKVTSGDDTLIVGTAADFPPFSFIDKSDEIVGFDIDIVKEIARRLNANIKIVDRQFSMLLPQIQLGQIQIIAAGMTPTAERAKKIRFTKPYLKHNPLVIASLKSRNLNINSLEDLKSKSAIVNTGYTADAYISDLSESKNINIIRLSKVEDAIIALNHGKADVFITAQLTLKPYLKDTGLEKYNIFIIPNTCETSSLGISKLVPQALFEKIEQAIQNMKKDGTLKSIKQRWGFLN